MNDDHELREIARAELYPDEKLLWVGKPSPMRVVMQSAQHGILIFVTIFALVFGSLLVTQFHIGVGEARSLLFGLILIPLVPLLISSGYSYWRATQIVYAVSNRRALIIRQTIDGKSVLAYNIMPYIERRDRANDKGDVIFASKTLGAGRHGYRSGFNRDSYVRTREIGFFGIANVREVEQLLFRTFVKGTAVNEH